MSRSYGRWWLTRHHATLPPMETTHALNDDSPLDEATQASPLLQQLYQLYTAARQLALDRAVLFHPSNSIPMRLDLSDRRKEATRHLLRLERVIQMTTGNPASYVVAGMTTLRPSPIAPGEEGVTFEIPLRALQVAIASYGEAISTATRFGQSSIAEVLTETLSEKDATIIALSSR